MRFRSLHRMSLGVAPLAKPNDLKPLVFIVRRMMALWFAWLFAFFTAARTNHPTNKNGVADRALRLDLLWIIDSICGAGFPSFLTGSVALTRLPFFPAGAIARARRPCLLGRVVALSRRPPPFTGEIPSLCRFGPVAPLMRGTTSLALDGQAIPLASVSIEAARKLRLATFRAAFFCYSYLAHSDLRSVCCRSRRSSALRLHLFHGDPIR